ncbi:P-loop containing nucleoside triphosphate hydrolase protein [Flagelloscypha sp. PMI_526]|nr:P-loop containing nucleoside triphosphate hydrolase protein [Flagelloscypha sp. PMI_526]
MGNGRVPPPYAEGVGYEGVGGKDIELERKISRSDFYSGRCFGSGGTAFASPSTASSNHIATATPLSSAAKPYTVPKAVASSSSSSSGRRGFVSLQPVPLTSSSSGAASTPSRDLADEYWTVNWRKTGHPNKNRPWDGDAFLILSSVRIGVSSLKTDRLISATRMVIGGVEIQLDEKIPASRMPGASGDEEVPDIEIIHKEPVEKSTSAKSFYNLAPPKARQGKPLYDPEADGAIVMKAPSKDHQKLIDPMLGRKLRDHQIEGVKFMYECVMGLRKHEGNGCILADDIRFADYLLSTRGLGKTLRYTTIALIWTLLKQNPYGGNPTGAHPILDKVLIACPASLTQNWQAEFHKWLGRDRLGVSVCDKGSKADNIIAGFMNSKSELDLSFATEGHRLKSSEAKTTKMFEALKTPRRILLSGTPIQNDLSELHCNGLTFAILNPIVKSRQPDSTKKEIELVSFLRREAAILGGYLPPKCARILVFVKPTAMQRQIFDILLDPRRDEFTAKEALPLIALLTKVSADPILLKVFVEKEKDEDKEISRAPDLIPDQAELGKVTMSGKLMALSKLLKAIDQGTDEKVVIVSQYTSVLTVLETYCQKKKYSCIRLDGQSRGNRLDLVNRFNKESNHLLLSTKAGGVGLNLIGGSRLILLDSSWNPADDMQAMARCHRDGQKRPVHIYRFLTAGAIDEKVYQRQVTKLGLSHSLIGSEENSSKNKSDSFTKKELKDLFTFHSKTPCNTHDLLECQCMAIGKTDMEVDSPMDEDNDYDDEDAESKGFLVASQVKPSDIQKPDKAFLQKKKASLASLEEWEHIDCLAPSAWGKLLKGDSEGILNGLLHWKDDPFPNTKLKGQNLLDALDKMQPEPKWDEVKGGTIGMVFRKISDSASPEKDPEKTADVEMAIDLDDV